MTPYAISALVWLTPAAVTVVALGLGQRRRRGPHRRRWAMFAGAATAFLVASAAVVAGWALPDDADRLDRHQHAAVRPALAASYRCGAIPFARVLAVDVDPASMKLSYRCGLTHLGLFPRSDTAECQQGGWVVRGVVDTADAGDCSRAWTRKAISR